MGEKKRNIIIYMGNLQFSTRMLKKVHFQLTGRLCLHRNNALSVVRIPRTHKGKLIFNFLKYCMFVLIRSNTIVLTRNKTVEKQN